MVNVFLVHSPYQVLVASLVARQIRKEWAGQKFYLIFEGVLGECEFRFPWDQVFVIEATEGKWLGRKERKKVDSSLREIFHNIVTSEKVKIYFSDLAWPLNNHFSIISEKLTNGECSFYIFEDGMGSYVCDKVSFLQAIKMRVRKAVGLLRAGLMFRPYRGLYLGQLNPIVEGVYCFSPSLVSVPTGKEIKIKEKIGVGDRSKQKNGIVLILDQPWKGKVNRKAIEHSRIEVFNFIERLKEDREQVNVYVKRHPRDLSGEKSYFDFDSANMMILNCSACAEDAVASLQPEYVLSLNSTSLLNIKLATKDIICIYIDIPENLLDNKKERVYFMQSKRVFEHVGVVPVSNVQSSVSC